MTWPEVALAAVNTVQVIALAWLAVYARSTTREVERINGELQDALRGAEGPRERGESRIGGADVHRGA